MLGRTDSIVPHVSNDWSPSDPTRAVTLFSTWSALLPSFLSSNILDQLVLPKLSTAISEWSPSAYKRGQAPGLHTIVFPWLEVAGQERMDGLLDECKRRVRSWVKSGWKAKEGVPQGLEVWKDVSGLAPSFFFASPWLIFFCRSMPHLLGRARGDDRRLRNPTGTRCSSNTFCLRSARSSGTSS